MGYAGSLTNGQGHGAATYLFITTQPAGGYTAISGFAVQPVLEARNVFGVKDITYAGTVTATIASGSGGTITGGASVAFVAGVGTWTALAMTGLDTFTFSFGDGSLVPAVSSSAATDFLGVRDALGGDSAIAVVFTTRTGLTASGANFTTLDEARKNFSGPTIPQITVESGTPGWDAANKLITVDGSSSSCATAVDAAFNLDSPSTFTTFAFGIGASNGNNLVGIQAPGRWMALQAVSGHYWGYYGADFAVPTMNSPSAISSTRRMFTLGFDALGTQKFDVWGNMGPNKDYAAHGGAFAADSCKLKIGNGVTGRGAFKFSAYIKLTRAATSADTDVVTRWGAAYEGAVEDKVATHMFFADGDSRVECDGPSPVVNGTNDLITQLFAATGLTADRCYVNCGVGGTTLAIMVAKFDTKIGPALRASTAAKKIVLCIDPGFNDIILAPFLDADHVYALQKQYNDLAKAAGATTVVFTTCYGYGSGRANGNNAIVFALNAKLLGNSLFTPDHVVDLASISQNSQYDDPAIFNADKIHKTIAGYGYDVNDPVNGIAAYLVSIY